MCESLEMLIREVMVGRGRGEKERESESAEGMWGSAAPGNVSTSARVGRDSPRFGDL